VNEWTGEIGRTGQLRCSLFGDAENLGYFGHTDNIGCIGFFDATIQIFQALTLDFHNVFSRLNPDL